MALIARIKHPYIVEFKEAWVEKVSGSLNSLLIANNSILCVLNLYVIAEIVLSVFSFLSQLDYDCFLIS